MTMLDPTKATIGQLIRKQTDFMPHIDLVEAHNRDYRAACSKAYIYVPEDEQFFKNVVKALTNQLPNKRHVLLEEGPYGVGKSLLDIVRGDVFAKTDNGIVLNKLPAGFWKAQIEDLIRDSGYLVVYLAGAHPSVRGHLDRAFTAELERALPPGVLLESQFEHALEWVASTHSGGSHQTWRGSFENVLASLNTSGSEWTVSQLEEGLKRHEPDAFEVFRHAVEIVMRWPPATFGAATAAEVYEAVRAQHTGPGQQFAGILIFFDEFSQWAESASAADISTLQSFVEWVNRSSHVALIMSSQEKPQRQGALYDDLQTLIGRTQEVTFSRLSYANLLSGALERTISPYPPLDNRPDWARLTELHRELFPDELNPDRSVRAYYPFHPAAVKALPALADQLGHHERSIAQYLSAGPEESGFGQFLEQHLFEDDRGVIREVTLDRLYSYFSTRLRTEKHPIYDWHKQALEHISGELGRRLVEILALSDVLGASAPLELTVKGFQKLLNLPPSSDSEAEIEHQLQELADNALVLMDDGGRYMVSTSGGISLSFINRAIQQQKQGLLSRGERGDGVSAIPLIESSAKMALEIRGSGFRVPLEAELPFSKEAGGKVRKVDAKQYEDRYKVQRQYSVELYSARQLFDLQQRVANENPKNSRYESLLIVIVTDAEASVWNLNQLQVAARALLQFGITVAVPRAPLAISDAVRDLHAAQEVAQQDRYRGTALTERAVAQQKSQLLMTFASEVKVEAFAWYVPGLLPNDDPLSITTLSDVIDRVALHLGRGLPQGVAYTKLVTGSSNAQVIDMLLLKEFPLSRKSQPPQPERILSDALAKIGLIKIHASQAGAQAKNAEVIIPDPIEHPDTRKIWDILDQNLGRGGDGAVITSVRDTLSQEPYWLPKDLSLYFFAALIALRDLHIYQLGTRDEHVRNSDIIRKIWDNPSNYLLRLAPSTPVSAEALKLLRTIWEAASSIVTDPPRTWGVQQHATSLTEDQITILAKRIRMWNDKVGRPGRELEASLQITLPSPLHEWLTFLSELQEGKLDEATGETFTKTLFQRICPNPTMYARYPGLLDMQMGQLSELLRQKDMLRRAKAVIQASTESSELTAAWEVFRREPLEELRRDDLQAALTAMSLHSEEQTLAQIKHSAGDRGSDHAPPLEDQSDEITGSTVISSESSGESPRSDYSEQQRGWIDLHKPSDGLERQESLGNPKTTTDWLPLANAIAQQPIDAATLRQCILMLEQLLAETEKAQIPPTGDQVLSQIVTSLVALPQPVREGAD